MPEPSPEFLSSPALARVGRGDLCAGCGLCAGLAPEAISMKTVAPGFSRPEQTFGISEHQERQIASCCPGLGQSVVADKRTDHELWGPFISMTVGHSTDPATRYAGSSGGGLSQALIHLVENNIVDVIVQTKDSASLPIGNQSVVTATRDDIVAAAGSRYAPSSPLEGLHTYVADGRRYAFVGKPCDAAALRAISHQDPAVAAAFPVILSFFCAGVPSHAGGAAVLDALGANLNDVSAFRFRGNGWPGLATATLKNGETRSMSYHDSWGKILSKHVQHRCKICADGTGTAADIVCADAWECDEKGYPVFAEADGVSLIVARTALGQSILDDMNSAGVIQTTSFDVATLAAIQPGQRERRRALFARLAALKLIGKPIPEYRGLRIRDAARQNSLKKNIRNFLGTLRRALKTKR